MYFNGYILLPAVLSNHRLFSSYNLWSNFSKCHQARGETLNIVGTSTLMAFSPGSFFFYAEMTMKRVVQQAPIAQS